MAERMELIPRCGTLDIRNCLRCGGQHDSVEFRQFKRSFNDLFTHWVTCPTTKEPIVFNYERSPQLAEPDEKNPPSEKRKDRFVIGTAARDTRVTGRSGAYMILVPMTWNEAHEQLRRRRLDGDRIYELVEVPDAGGEG